MFTVHTKLRTFSGQIKQLNQTLSFLSLLSFDFPRVRLDTLASSGEILHMTWHIWSGKARPYNGASGVSRGNILCRNCLVITLRRLYAEQVTISHATFDVARLTKTRTNEKAVPWHRTPREAKAAYQIDWMRTFN